MQRINITPSILAADIFDLQNWIKKMQKHEVKKFHVDFIDPSFANTIGMDIRILEKLHLMNIKYDVHYMAKWNKKLIQNIMQTNVRKIFFHQKHVEDIDFFQSISSGIALSIGEKAIIDCDEYIIMHVQPGYCGQNFDTTNIEYSKFLKKQNKRIIADGGITPNNVNLLKHYNELVIGSSLNQYELSEFI